MTCRNCGIQIADKALVCYRCGTATTEPRITSPDPRATPRQGRWPVAIAVVAIVAVAVRLVPMTPADSLQRLAAWAAVIVATALAVAWLRPRSRRR